MASGLGASESSHQRPDAASWYSTFWRARELFASLAPMLASPERLLEPPAQCDGEGNQAGAPSSTRRGAPQLSPEPTRFLYVSSLASENQLQDITDRRFGDTFADGLASLDSGWVKRDCLMAVKFGAFQDEGGVGTSPSARALAIGSSVG